jgi:hypothetical protein
VRWMEVAFGEVHANYWDRDLDLMDAARSSEQ